METTDSYIYDDSALKLQKTAWWKISGSVFCSLKSPRKIGKPDCPHKKEAGSSSKHSIFQVLLLVVSGSQAWECPTKKKCSTEFLEDAFSSKICGDFLASNRSLMILSGWNWNSFPCENLDPTGPTGWQSEGYTSKNTRKDQFVHIVSISLSTLISIRISIKHIYD